MKIVLDYLVMYMSGSNGNLGTLGVLVEEGTIGDGYFVALEIGAHVHLGPQRGTLIVPQNGNEKYYSLKLPGYEFPLIGTEKVLEYRGPNENG